MKALIQKVIAGVILNEFEVTRNGKYKVIESLSVSWGKRNCPDGYWIHIKESGGFDNHNSFYGNYGEPFDSAEEAARKAIENRGIVAVDAQGRVVRRKNNGLQK